MSRERRLLGRGMVTIMAIEMMDEANPTMMAFYVNSPHPKSTSELT
jgi:hypothetical protein